MIFNTLLLLSAVDAEFVKSVGVPFAILAFLGLLLMMVVRAFLPLMVKRYEANTDLQVTLTAKLPKIVESQNAALGELQKLHTRHDQTQKIAASISQEMGTSDNPPLDLS